jgi:hypothetical protein
MLENLQTAADLSKIGHISSKLNTFPQKWGHLHRGDIIDLPKVLGNGFQI